MDEQAHDNEPEPVVPEDLVRDLRALVTPAETPSPAVDERILAAARIRLGVRPRETGLRRRWWIPVAAAAALMAWLVLGGSGPRADLDGDGRVDVLDAFHLARMLRDSTTSPRHDVNGDGVVDGRDVDLVVAEAVRL